MNEPPFNKSKFLKLPLHLQHKKCADLLRAIYGHLLDKKDPASHFSTYQNYSEWMALGVGLKTGIKDIADSYHFHIAHAKEIIKEHDLLPPIRRGDHKPKEDFPPIAIYMDNLRSAYNVGSILRTTEALRLGSLHFGGKTPFINNKKVEKTSMGASSLVPCFITSSLADLPRPFIALETAEEAVTVSNFPFPQVFTLFLGNEEYGISDDVLKEIDHFVHIPLFGAKNSINVACAFAICGQEIRKQKGTV